MKNQFLYRRQARASLLGPFAVAILISIMVFGFDTLTGGLVRSYARTLGTLAWTAAAGSLSAADRNGILTTRRSLESENASLKQELALRDEKAVRFSALEAQNASLKEMAHLAENEGAGVTARVLSSFSVSPYGTFLLGAGKSEGIEKGSIVLTSGGFILGTISDLDLHTATVAALFAPGNTIDVQVQSVAFSAEGRGGGNARAEVPRDAKVALNDPVIVPAYGGRAAGIVGSVESASSSATQTLFIRIPANLTVLDFVYVISHQ